MCNKSVVQPVVTLVTLSSLLCGCTLVVALPASTIANRRLQVPPRHHDSSAFAAERLPGPRVGSTVAESQAGRVYSWSVDNNRRVVGRSEGEPGQLLPIALHEADVVSVAAGGHSLAVSALGELYSWGRNDSRGGGGYGSDPIDGSGQLGDAREDVPVGLPGKVSVPGGLYFVAVAAGRYHSVGLDNKGHVYTWGLNDYGQLGRLASDGQAEACSQGAACHCGQLTQVTTGRSGSAGPLPKVIAIAAGRYHTLAVGEDGSVWTWGLNACGLSDTLAAADPQAKWAEPRQVQSGLEAVRVRAVDAGYVHWLALADNGDVWTCDTGFDGYAGLLPASQQTGGLRTPNAEGELGRNLSPNGGLMPGKVEGLQAAAAAAGRCSSLAVAADGQVWSWGCGSLGREGDASRPGPVTGLGPSSPGGRAIAVAAGEWSSAAITENGKVYAWGSTGAQQHGTVNVATEIRNQPLDGQVMAISAAHQHFLAIYSHVDSRQGHDPSTRGGAALQHTLRKPAAVQQHRSKGGSITADSHIDHIMQHAQQAAAEQPLPLRKGKTALAARAAAMQAQVLGQPLQAASGSIQSGVAHPRSKQSRRGKHRGVVKGQARGDGVKAAAGPAAALTSADPVETATASAPPSHAAGISENADQDDVYMYEEVQDTVPGTEPTHEAGLFGGDAVELPQGSHTPAASADNQASSAQTSSHDKGRDATAVIIDDGSVVASGAAQAGSDGASLATVSQAVGNLPAHGAAVEDIRDRAALSNSLDTAKEGDLTASRAADEAVKRAAGLMPASSGAQAGSAADAAVKRAAGLEPASSGTHASSAAQLISGQTSPASHVRSSKAAEPGQQVALAHPAARVAEEVRRAAPDIFDAMGPLDKQYRNPCFRNASGALRCLPYFSIIGVSKCGTTDLYKKLLQMPGVADNSNKGPHFWDEQHTFDWYLDIYQGFAAKLVQDPQLVTGDASSNTYSYTSVGIRGEPNAEVLLPRVLKAVQPDMKLIVMLRNPVDRMYSAFWYYGCLYGIYKHLGMDAEGFHKLVEGEVGKMQACQETASAKVCAARLFHEAQQLIKGMYSVVLQDWRDVYASDQLMMINTAQYQSDEEQTLRDVVDFLGLERPSARQLQQALAVESNRGHNKQSSVPGCEAMRPPMLNHTRAMLEAFYRPFNQQLAIMLQDDTFNWVPAT